MMGEAKRRGTYEQRKAAAIEKREARATKSNGGTGITVRRPRRAVSTVLAIAAGLLASR